MFKQNIKIILNVSNEKDKLKKLSEKNQLKLET